MRHHLLSLLLVAGCAAPPSSAVGAPEPRAPDAPVTRAPLAGGPVSASRDDDVVAGARVTFDGRGRPLEEVLDDLGRQAGLNLVLEPGLAITVDLSLRDVSLEDALRLLERRHGLETRRLGERVRWITCPPRVTLRF